MKQWKRSGWVVNITMRTSEAVSTRVRILLALYNEPFSWLVDPHPLFRIAIHATSRRIYEIEHRKKAQDVRWLKLLRHCNTIHVKSIHTYRVKKQLEFPAATSPLKGHMLHYLDCQNLRHLSARKTWGMSRLEELITYHMVEWAVNRQEKFRRSSSYISTNHFTSGQS